MTGNSGKRLLPPLPHPDHLRKQAKMRLAAMRARAPSARLAEAQALLAREYGFRNWAELQAEVARRAASPLGQHRHVKRQHLAPLRPGWWREAGSGDEEEVVTAFFRSGVILLIGFMLIMLVGLGLVLWAFHIQGLLPSFLIRPGR
jgi:hypothetical protein